jgi:energy-coupling factor transporter ATP-binding protein EcfA2
MPSFWSAPGTCASKPPYLLSGGEKKRVAIATVLAMSPDILVLDEPTSGLDPFARRQLMALVRDFRHTRIIASHDLDLVIDLCERTVVLHEGESPLTGKRANYSGTTRCSRGAGWRSRFRCRGVRFVGSFGGSPDDVLRVPVLFSAAMRG